MGVMRCGRSDCDNVLCHDMINGMYICFDCLQELEKEKEKWPEEMTEAEMEERIDAFMRSSTKKEPMFNKNELFEKMKKR